MEKQAGSDWPKNTKQCMSLETGKIRAFGNECGRNKPYASRLGDNYTNGSRPSLPLSFSSGTSATGFSSSPPPLQPLLAAPVGHRIGSTRHQRVNPCFTASETEAGPGVLQGWGREGGVRKKICASTLRRPDRRVQRVSTKWGTDFFQFILVRWKFTLQQLNCCN